MPNAKDRKQRLDHLISVTQQQYGSKGLQQGIARSARAPSLSTGFAVLDEALGIGGIPQGKLTVLRGRLTSGKRVLAALLLAHVQKTTKRSCAYIDLTGACDAELLARCGVALDRLFVLRPTDSREALDMALTLAERTELGLVVIDEWGSIAADRMTRRLATQVVEQIVARQARSGVTVVVLDGVVSAWQELVSAVTNPAHSALAQHAAVRLALRHKQWVMVGPDMRGYHIAVTIERNKLGTAGQTVEIVIRYNGTVQGDGL